MEEQAFREKEEEEFRKRTIEALDRCEDSDEEYSIEEFLEEIKKW